jgi:hypothetical protein
MNTKETTPKAWIYITVWFLYVAGATLYGEYIVSRPMNVWIQAICSLLLLIATFYIFRFTFGPFLKNTPKP